MTFGRQCKAQPDSDSDSESIPSVGLDCLEFQFPSFTGKFTVNTAASRGAWLV